MKPAINRRLFTRFPSNDNDETVSHRVSNVNTLGIDMVPREKGHLHQEWRQLGTGRHSSSPLYSTTMRMHGTTERERERGGGGSSPHDNEGEPRYDTGNALCAASGSECRLRGLVARSYFHTNCNTCGTVSRRHYCA